MAGNKNSGAHFKGKKPEGSGRVAGMKNLSVILFNQVMDRYANEIEDGTFVSPISFWTDILNDPHERQVVKDKAAEKLAKYFHQALPTQVEQTIIDDKPELIINFTNKNAD